MSFSSTSCNQYQKYLSDCDLINKYSIDSVHSIPKLKNITLNINLGEFFEVLDISNKDQSNYGAQIRAYLTLYMLNCFEPFINSVKVISTSKKQKVADVRYSLKISINKTSNINDFLFLLFVESKRKLELEDFNFFKTTSGRNKFFSNKNKDLFVFKTCVPGGNLFEIESFLLDNFKNVNPKNLKLHTSFKFSSLNNVNVNVNMIKNIPFFWFG